MGYFKHAHSVMMGDFLNSWATAFRALTMEGSALKIICNPLSQTKVPWYQVCYLWIAEVHHHWLMCVRKMAAKEENVSCAA